VGQTTDWRGNRDTTRRTLGKLLVLSLLLHSPLTPIVALFGLFGLISRPQHGAVEEPQTLTAIPVDLLQTDRPEPGSPPAPEKPAAPSEPPKEKDPSKDLEKPEPKHAMAIESEERRADAGTEDEALALAERADGGDAGAGGPGGAIGDPVALSGRAGRVADANANVRLIVFTDKIRGNPLGPRVGTLLGQAYQWRDFFGPSGLDPIRDVDRILIAGPQLRNSSGAVAVVKYNVSELKMRSAIDALVRRDTISGGWLDAGVPAAVAHADRAERVFVMPAPGIVVVTPQSAAQHALTLGRDIRFPPSRGSEVVTGYLVTPWRAFNGLPYDFPKSIKWLRLEVTPAADGGAFGRMVAEDESEEAARTHAAEFQQAVDALINVKLGVLGALFGKKDVRLIEKVTFEARGKEIHGFAVATPKQLVSLLDSIAQLAKEIADQNARREREARPKEPLDAGSGANAPDLPRPSLPQEMRPPDAG